MNELLINNLRIIFGLNDYESKIMATLYLKGILSATQLSKYSIVPRVRVYDVCESLESKHLIKIIPRAEINIKGKEFKYKQGFYKKKKKVPVRFEAVDIDKLIDVLEKSWIEEIKVKIEILKKNKDNVKKLIRGELP